MLDELKNRTSGEENVTRMADATNDFITEAAKLHNDGISPESEQRQDLAKRYWGWLMEVSGGDVSLVLGIVIWWIKDIIIGKK